MFTLLSKIRYSFFLNLYEFKTTTGLKQLLEFVIFFPLLLATQCQQVKKKESTNYPNYNE